MVPGRGVVGRPVKFTAARQNVALQALRDGMTRVAASAKAGVHRQTLYTYMTDNVAFSDAVELAEDEAEAYMTERALSSLGTDVPKDDAWKWLQRRRRDDWSPQTNVKADVATTGTTEVIVTFVDEGDDDDANG